MEIKDIQVHFTENPEQEAALLGQELRLARVVEHIRNENTIPEDVKDDLKQLLVVVADLFNTSVPMISGTMEENLRLVSRDINLSRILRERALFRFFQLVEDRVVEEVPDPFGGGAMIEEEIPVFMTRTNPNTGSPFRTQEEFVGLFCEEASVSRTLVFQRLSAIRKALGVGLDLEEAFDIIIRNPSGIQKVLNLVAKWEKGEMVEVDPFVAGRIAETYLMDEGEVDEIKDLAGKVGDDPSLMGDLFDRLKGPIKNLMTEVSLHERPSDAIDLVKYDILAKPEITWYWDEELECPVARVVEHQIDAEGHTYTAGVTEVPFRPDVPRLPRAVKEDLLKRLPFKNKIYIQD